MATAGTRRDIGYEAHQAAEAFINTLAGLEELEAETGEDQDWPDTAGPYCGCTTCDIREALFAAFTVIERALREAGHDAAADLLAMT